MTNNVNTKEVEEKFEFVDIASKEKRRLNSTMNAGNPKSEETAAFDGREKQPCTDEKSNQ